MPDRHAVIWTRMGGGPAKMGDVVVTSSETRFSYDAEYLALGSEASGLSLLSSRRLFGANPVIFRARDRLPFHPRLMALVPGEGRGNIQRRLYTRVVERQQPPPAPGFETDWALLLLAGRNGIGHIDVFRDDRAAERWYAESSKSVPSKLDRSKLWRALREDIALDVAEMDAEALATILGPTPSAGGMIPKLLVAIPDADTWDGRLASPGTRDVDGTPYLQVVLKVEPQQYEGVAELEALCLEVHRDAGLEVPRWWRTSIDGLELLAVERFDRDAACLPVPMESFYSVFAVGDRRFTTNTDTHLAEVGRRLERVGSVANLDVNAAQREVYRRLCMAVCTGNGDLHLENLSLLGGASRTRVAPVYDPAPMRAWPRHDLRFAVPLDFDESLGFGENLVELGRAYGLSRRQSRDEVERALSATRDYVGRLEASNGVPAPRIERLIRVVRREREELSRVV